MSENIIIKRLVDRYLEHGRVYIFNNNGDKEIFLGSADWMNRNVYHRIEVCFPVFDQAIKDKLIRIVDLQLKDNVSAVYLDEKLENKKIIGNESPVRAQYDIYKLLSLN